VADKPFTPKVDVDFLADFQKGMNQGISPLLLPKNQLANAVNCTVRGTFVNPRASFRRIALDYGGDTALQTAVENSLWQGGCYFKPDNGPEMLQAAIAGRLFKFVPSGATAVVSEIPITGGPNDTTRPLAWLWQSEKWTIWNDGISPSIFVQDGLTARRSNYGVPSFFNTTMIVATPPLAAGITDFGGTVQIAVASTANLDVGDIVTLKGIGQYVIQDQSNSNAVIIINQNAVPKGKVIPTNTIITWQHIGTELPPGRMGAYGMGRNWVSLVDGKQFVASDLVGGSSGTQANNYRDAVLNVTENNFLAGGGYFTVPGSAGDIRAMRFAATLDKSLGQGPLQVFTPKIVFSCNAPVDRATWQDLTNPILTESLIANGALGQNSTQVANGDIMFRALDGIRSLVLGQRQFSTWGNTPQSREVQPTLDKDSIDLLIYSSSVVFDNRLLMTVRPNPSNQGVYFTGLVALNFDPISTLQSKAESVYDGLWSGLNVLQLLVGDFNLTERCFAFTLNTITHAIELYEILPSASPIIADNGTSRIVMELESSVLFKDNQERHELLRLQDGEIYVDDLQGKVDFKVYWKPDQWPCFVPWLRWSECAGTAKDSGKPQFRPRMGLGEPPPDPCDETNNRPLREGYTFQVKLIITGHCRFLGALFKAVTIPQPQFAKPNCDASCPDV